MVTKSLNQNVHTFQAPNCLFHDHTYATNRVIFRLLLWTQRRIRIRFGLPWFFVRLLDCFRGIPVLDPLIAEITPEDKILKPRGKRLFSALLRGRKFLLKARIVMDTASNGQPEKEDPLADRGDDRIFDRMPFFFPLNFSRCSSSS